MNTFGSTKSKINPKNIIGGIIGSYDDYDETGFEKESAISAVASTFTSVINEVTSGIYEAASGLGQDIKNPESKTESGGGKFPASGSIEFNKKQAEFEQKEKDRAKVEKKKVFFQALKEDQDRAQRAKEKLLFEEEINDIATNLPTEQKNQLLGYQASYRDRSVYQRAELRKKLIEQRKNVDKQQKEATATQTNKGFKVGENGLLMGGERSGGGHWSTTPG